MSQLEIVNLDEDDLNYALDNLVNFGSESNITLGRATNRLFKIFHQAYLDMDDMREKKEKKIRLLSQATGKLEIPFFPKIYSILTYQDEFIGYEMSANLNDNSLDAAKDNLSRGELITVLKEVKDYLLFLHRHPLNIVYGDLHASNILFNESDAEIRLCDIDNISVKGSGFDVMGDVQSSFLEHHKGKITPSLDVYMHNVLTRDLLFDCDSLDPLVKKYVKYKPKGFLIDEF